MSKKLIVIIITLLILVASAGIVYKFVFSSGESSKPANKIELTKVDDKQLGVSFSIPASYQRQADTPPAVGQKDTKPAINFEQVSPQGLFTVRSESGLAVAASALRMPLIEYIQSNISQFSPNQV